MAVAALKGCPTPSLFQGHRLDGCRDIMGVCHTSAIWPVYVLCFMPSFVCSYNLALAFFHLSFSLSFRLLNVQNVPKQCGAWLVKDKQTKAACPFQTLQGYLSRTASPWRCAVTPGCCTLHAHILRGRTQRRPHEAVREEFTEDRSDSSAAFSPAH